MASIHIRFHPILTQFSDNIKVNTHSKQANTIDLSRLSTQLAIASSVIASAVLLLRRPTVSKAMNAPMTGDTL